jgi:hypothetical protein
MKDSKLRKVTAFLAKVIEVVGWFGAALMIITTVILMVGKKQIMEAYQSGTLKAGSITLTGTVNNSPEWAMDVVGRGGAVFIFIPLAILCVLTALVFRNVYMIFKASNVASPFSMENVKRIRNIGIYAIALPIVKVVAGLISFIAMKNGDYALSVELSEVVFGLVALCLSQYFAYGAELQSDVDGLL